MRGAIWTGTVAAILVAAAACGEPEDPRGRAPALRDIADDVGLGERTRTYGALAVDYDDDGDDDLFLGRHAWKAQLYEAVDGGFRLVDDVEFPQVDRHGCAAGDVDGDGRVDIACALGGHDGERPREVPHELWLQEGAGRFTNGAGDVLADPWGRGRRVVLFDVERDGDLDLYVGSSHPRSDGRPSTNRLFLNDGDADWRAAPELGLDEPWSVGSSGPGPPRGCLVTVDADDDGWTDVLICVRDVAASARGGQTSRPLLLRNDGGRQFVDITASVGLPRWMVDAAPVDLDSDGDTDLVSVDDEGVRIHRQDAGAFVQIYEHRVLGALRVAVADVDGDDLHDIYVVRRRPEQHFGLPPEQREEFEAYMDEGRDVGDVLLLGWGSPDGLRRVSIPPPDDEKARADDVVPIDPDGDGRSELLVLNGPHKAAPLQVIDYG